MYQCADVGYKCGWKIMTLLIFIKNTILFIAKWSYKIKKAIKMCYFRVIKECGGLNINI